MKKIKPIYWVLLSWLIMIMIAIGWYVSQKKQIVTLQKDNMSFQTTITKKDGIISTQEQQIVTYEVFKDQDAEMIKQLRKQGLKDASVIVTLQTENTRLKIEAQYKPGTIIDTLVVHDGPDLKTYLRVPLPFEFKDQWLYYTGRVKTTGVVLDTLITYSQPSITLGWSTGFLKKSKPIVVFHDKNPYTVVTDMNNIVTQNPLKFYQTPWFHRVEGAAIAVGIGWGIKQIK
jgi:hypothetical protein